MDNEALAGGNTSGVVSRVGNSVRKQWTDSTASVTDFVDFLRGRGVDAPERRGRDAQGRQIIEFVPGSLAVARTPLAPAELRKVGFMIREIHDAAASYTPAAAAVWETAIPAPSGELVCHNDLAPWNLIIGERWAFIDWDAAAPSTRLWDLAYAAQAFTLSDTERAPEAAAADLAAFIDGYDADQAMRESLPRAMQERTAAMLALLEAARATGEEPWASMCVDGHGAHWKAALQYVSVHQAVWSRALLAD